MGGKQNAHDACALPRHLDSIGIAAALLDAELRIVEANSALMRRLSLPAEKLTGRLLIDLLTARAGATVNFHGQQLFCCHSESEGECWFRLDTYPCPDGAIGILVDVTAERLQIDHLRFTHRVTDELMEDAQIGVWRYDPDLRTVYASSSLSLGYATGRNIPLEQLNLSRHRDDAAKEDATRQRITREGGRGEEEIRYRNALGQWDYLRIHCRSGRRLPSGLYEMYGISQNVTPQAVVRDAANSHSHRLKMALMAANAVVYEYDYVTQKYWASEELAERFGVKVALIKDPPIDLFPEEDHEIIKAFIRRVARGAAGSEIDVRMNSTTGVRWVRIFMERITDVDGNDRRAVGLIIDIDAQKKQAIALAEAREAAEAAAEAKSNFLAAMSHEIRTPLNGVLGMAQSLDNDELTEIQREKVSIILESGNTLMALLNDVLDLSKIEAGRMDIVRVESDLSGTIERAVRLFQPAAEEKDLRLSYAVAGSLPSQFSYDPVRIRQCVSNLLSNAIKFTETGGAVDVRLSARRQADGRYLVTVGISDTGIGMSRETVDKLFATFNQADASTSRRYGGTGLGLAISRHLARLMDGEINVESTLGKGSHFRFTFKAQAAATASPSQGAQERPSAPRELAAANARVLLVDDNPVNRQIIKLFLASLSPQFHEAENGRQALDALHEKTFDIVLLDVHMPIMDGCETIKAIRASRESWRGIPVIALTADAMSGDKERYLALGMDDYVAKPIDQRELTTKIVTLLEQRKPSGGASGGKTAGEVEMRNDSNRNGPFASRRGVRRVVTQG
jgi:signal transduction histidine kinase/CheY-like chemotaxis protein